MTANAFRSATGVLLYGPPGVGKDTVTQHLTALGAGYALFQRLKAGPGKTSGYRMVEASRLATLDASGELLYRNQRYEAVYAVDEPGLRTLTHRGDRPIVHIGQVAGVRAVSAFPAYWCRVLLWCGLAASQERCRLRGDSDVEARKQAWHETRADLLANAQEPWSLVIDTERSSAAESAALIHEATRARVSAVAVDVPALVA